MSATQKQIKLIEDIMEAGCPIPEHPQFDRPDSTMFESVEAADKFIKKNKHYLAQKFNKIETSKRIRMDD